MPLKITYKPGSKYKPKSKRKAKAKIKLRQQIKHMCGQLCWFFWGNQKYGYVVDRGVEDMEVALS
jgi:hypothetical protein